MNNAWNGFIGGDWQNEINVRDFIQKNYTPYEGDGAFLAPATARTTKMREKFDALLAEEREKGGVRNIDTETVITITAFGAGYLDKENEVIVGLQTDEPLKRACNPFGGMRMVREACKAYGYEVSRKIEEEFKYHKTHNDGVFSAYTKDVREARHVGLLTGLPDAYGRGRIIGDYRRVALYGIDRLIAEKQRDKDALGDVSTTETEIRTAEELSDQILALRDMLKMAADYGFDISRPAKNAKEAVQWLYFGYLAGIRQQNGAAMSLGRTSTFLDIYFERDLAAGILTESEAQEIMDDFVL
ncbi:MAG TPA: formate acetyltransferase, partial [Candidatus Agathobaculum merdavium]|nr:formate acetyltransferase [Candidatus Agathobaculum merdavium]